MTCPDCDGDGYIEYDIAKPHNFHRDIGYIETVTETCPTCLGDGEVEDDDDDE